jgi:hypothetical protein
VNTRAWAIRFITASTWVAAACGLPFASTAHSEVATVPVPAAPSPPCDLPTAVPLIIWHHAPGVEDRAEEVDEADLHHCRPTLETWRATVPKGPGFCSKIAWSTDNPGYSTLISPTPPLKKVIDQVGDC